VRCQIALQPTKKACCSLGIWNPSACNCCLAMFFVEVKNFCLALFVKLELKHNSEQKVEANSVKPKLQQT